MAMHTIAGLKAAQQFGAALAELNFGDANAGSRDAQHGQELKRMIARGYDLFGAREDVVNANSELYQLWNWGMFQSDMRRELTELLGPFDQRITDGYSEQLYYYTLKQAPRTDDTPRRILEVGCGTGTGLNFLSRIESRSEFVGLDLSQSAVQRANERYARPGTLTYVHGDAENLPFDDASFDVVINVESSHNYPNLSKFFSEVARVLRPGGSFSHVDIFSDVRYAAMQGCKRQTERQLSWGAETDISPQVKEAIRRRMAPGSLFRKHLTHSLRSFRWPANVAHGEWMLDSYGRGFADPGSEIVNKVFAWRRSPRIVGILRLASSYRHTLATKPAK